MLGFEQRDGCDLDVARPAIMPGVTDPFAGLEPVAFWRHFEALTKIARPSFEEHRIAAHVIGWAEALGLQTRRDGAGNLVVRVPATPGREHAATVILQGHLDMVCERDPDSPYDPREGRIGVRREGDWLLADGTTLGADDGVAIAAMLAFAEDPDARHGPLELLMTVAEEVGLAGAAELDPELISGTALVNLDSEEDGTLIVGCAGGADSILRLRAARGPAGPDEFALRVRVSGARGGHSGGDIAAGRANAIKLLARALGSAPDLRIVSLAGGASRNAIPRDAVALVVVGAAVAASARERIAAAGADAARAFSTTDPGVEIEVTAVGDGSPPADAWPAATSARIVDLLMALPVGPLRMSADFPGVVETSTSLGVAATDRDALTLHCLSRSSNDAAMPDVTGAIAAAGRLAGAEVELTRQYPGWQPDLGSSLLATAKTVHEHLFGTPPQVSLTHGGLEAAIIAAKRPGIDAISFGPQIEGPHAPGERLHVASAARFMRLLATLLDELSR
jgi:dipeptidase D